MKLRDLPAAEKRRVELAFAAKNAEDWPLARRRWGALTRRLLHGHFWLELAYAEKHLGNYEAALRALRQGEQLAPRSVMIQEHLGVVLQELRRWRLSIRALRKAIARKPSPEAYVFLACGLGQLGDRAGAIEALHGALRVDPMYEEAHFNLAVYDVRAGQRASAERRLRRAIDIDPVYVLALDELAALVAERNPAEAALLGRRAREAERREDARRAQ